MTRARIHHHLAHMPLHGGRFLYAVQFHSGVVKVGMTQQPRERLRQLQKSRGELVAHAFVHALKPRTDARVAERTVLAELSALCAPLAGHVEFFAGLQFDDAVRAVQKA